MISKRRGCTPRGGVTQLGTGTPMYITGMKSWPEEIGCAIMPGAAMGSTGKLYAAGGMPSGPLGKGRGAKAS
eukprot:scaffold888_cov246-Pinguiococcus_pyrenoidosus.AAC.9